MDMEEAAYLEIEDEELNARYITIEVVEPVVLTTRESALGRSTSFTSYLIRIETDYLRLFPRSYSSIRRRYSEFCWLYEKLTYSHPLVCVPILPPKRILHAFKFNSKFIEQRRLGLNRFLQEVLCSPVLLTDPAVQLFLQTDLSVGEIEGKLHEFHVNKIVDCPRLSRVKLARSHSLASDNSEPERPLFELPGPTYPYASLNGPNSSGSESDPSFSNPWSKFRRFLSLSFSSSVSVF